MTPINGILAQSPATERKPRPNRSRGRRPRMASIRTLGVAVVSFLLIGVLSACLPHWAAARIDLRVLVFDDGSGNVAMIRDELSLRGVPHDVIDLNDSGRSPVIEELLEDPASEAGHAYYQGIVLPSHRPASLSDAEMTTIEDYQRTFGVRRVAAFAWPGPESGPHWPASGPLYSGSIDGLAAEVFPLVAAAFPALVGPIPIADGSWGALGVSQVAEDGSALLPLVTAPIPGSDQEAVVLGIYGHDGVEEMQLTITGNPHQEHARILSAMVVDYITRGVHLGYSRNYFSLHIDDVFLPDDRWSIEGNCTPGEDCLPGPGGEPPAETSPIRMVPDDVEAAIAWQDANGIPFEMAFNAYGSDQVTATGADPLTDALLASAQDFRWINHTYRHDYLGCLKDLTVRPWRCHTDDEGQQTWYSEAEIIAEIQQNIDWAVARGIPINAEEMVAGEHSGLRTLPQQSDDNPHLEAALTATGIRWFASDNSREPEQRQVAGSLTVPRHPMNIFYNVATRAELIDEYNWIYNSAADGGSGICEVDPNSTCIAPLGPDGFESHIMPVERTIAMGHILRNDPRPHFVHQSNLAEERIILPVLDAILDSYHGMYSEAAPLVVPRQSEAGVLMRDMTNWTEAGVGPDARVTAYRQGKEVTVEVDGAPVEVPLTIADIDVDAGEWGEPWGGTRSAWTTVGEDTPLVVGLS